MSLAATKQTVWQGAHEVESAPVRLVPAPALARMRALLPETARRHLLSGRDLVEKSREEERQPLKTAQPALDRLLAGGLPRGRLVEILGGRSSGRFSAVLSILAAVTGTGQTAALIDLGDGLDPATAVRMGVATERLLWLRPKRIKEALAAAEIVLATGFPLVVVDLGLPPVCGGRGNEAAWLRLARAAAAQGAALVVSSPYRVSGTAASAVLRADRALAKWNGTGSSPRLLAGLSGHLALEKGLPEAPSGEERFELKVAQAFSSTSSGAPATPAAEARPQAHPHAHPQSIPRAVPPLRAAVGF